MATTAGVPATLEGRAGPVLNPNPSPFKDVARRCCSYRPEPLHRTCSRASCTYSLGTCARSANASALADLVEGLPFAQSDEAPIPLGRASETFDQRVDQNPDLARDMGTRRTHDVDAELGLRIVQQEGLKGTALDGIGDQERWSVRRSLALPSPIGEWLPRCPTSIVPPGGSRSGACPTGIATPGQGWPYRSSIRVRRDPAACPAARDGPGNRDLQPAPREPARSCERRDWNP